MGNERITLTNSPHESNKSVDAISVLVVDDDITCLALVAAILKKFEYEVVTVKHANDALCTLRIKHGAFDLVVSDVNMPDMNGFELQRAIAQEFNSLPVILMSADDKDGVAIKGLESGAAFFICKPVCAEDVRYLWQFAAMKKKSEVVIEEIKDNNNNCKEITTHSVSSSSVSNKDSKRNSPIKKDSDANRGQTSSQKKTKKIVWTNSLHNRFLEAIRSIGLDRAVPKRILEVMDVPGLTRENVASHLQKYRIFLRRVSDASYKIQYSRDHKSLNNNLFRSSIVSSIPPPSITPSTLLLNRLTKFPYPKPGQHPESGFSGQSPFLSNNINPARLKLNTPNTNLINHPVNPGHIPNMTLENLPSVLSAPINPAHTMSNNPGYQTNYAGYSISNLKRLTEKHDQGLNNFGHVTIEPTSSDNYTNVNCGEQLSDVVAGYRVMPLSSDLPLQHYGTVGNVNGSGYSSMLDMPEFNALVGQQPLGGVDFDANLGDRVNIQNQAQKNGGENIMASNIYGYTSHWDNYVPSLDQVHNQQQDLVRSQQFGTSAQLPSKPLVSHTERDDEEFLDSLLAPFGEDQTLGGF